MREFHKSPWIAAAQTHPASAAVACAPAPLMPSHLGFCRSRCCHPWPPPRPRPYQQRCWCPVKEQVKAGRWGQQLLGVWVKPDQQLFSYVSQKRYKSGLNMYQHRFLLHYKSTVVKWKWAWWCLFISAWKQWEHFLLWMKVKILYLSSCKQNRFVCFIHV